MLVQTVARITSLQLYDDQPVTQQHADERVLAREEHVCVAEDAVLEDEQHPQHEERRVLHHDRDYDAVHVGRTAALLFSRRRLCDFAIQNARPVLPLLRFIQRRTCAARLSCAWFSFHRTLSGKKSSPKCPFCVD